MIIFRIFFLPILIFSSSIVNHAYSQKSGWKSLGPFITPIEAGGWNATGIGRVNCITFHPDYGKKNSVIYAGMPTAGLYKSDNNGKSWKKVETKLTLEGVSDIVFDVNNKDIIYLASGDRDGIPNKFLPNGANEFSQSNGIAISKNGGKSWKEDRGNWNNDSTFWNYPSHKNITSIISTSKGILCSIYHLNMKESGFDSYVFKSIDYGKNWEMCLMTDSIMLREMVSMPGNDNIVFAAGEKAYFSISAGNPGTWVTLDLGQKKYSRIEFAASLKKNGIVYLFGSVENTGDVDLFTCDETGKVNLIKTYGNLYSGEPRFCYVLEASNTSDDLYFGNLPVYKIDSLKNIKAVTKWTSKPGDPKFVHVDVHGMRAAPDSNVMYIAHDGGISRTRDGGNSWEDISNGLDMSKIYRIACSQTSENILAGTQDAGTMLYEAESRNKNKWKTLRGGDGGSCIISYANDSIYVHSDGQNNILAVSENEGMNWVSITPRGQRGDFLKPVKQHPKKPETIFVGYHDVYKSDDLGKTWNKISDFSHIDKNKYLVVLEISSYNPDVIYAGYSGPTWNSEPSGRKDILFKTIDGGKTWSDISYELSGSHYTLLKALCTDPLSPETVFAGFGPAWDYKVMRSDDGGKTWINYTEGLGKDDGINALISYNRNVYAATHRGVYIRNIDHGGSWKKISKGLPNVPVYDLDIYKKKNKLRAATNGRGLWECTIKP